MRRSARRCRPSRTSKAAGRRWSRRTAGTQPPDPPGRAPRSAPRTSYTRTRTSASPGQFKGETGRVANRLVGALDAVAAELAGDRILREFQRSGRGRRARDLDRALVGRRRADVDEGDLPGHEDAWGDRVLRQDEGVAVLRVRELATVDAARGEADGGEEQLQPRSLRFAHGLRRERQRRL